MTNCLRVCNDNYVLNPTLVNNILASSQEANFPATNLLNSVKSIPWRSTSSIASTIWLDIDFNSPIVTNMIGVFFTNLSPTATVTAKLFTNVADVSPVYTSVATPVFNKNVTVSGVLGTQNTFSYGRGCSGVVYFPEHTVARVAIGINDLTNPDSYLQVGNILVGKYFSPLKNFAKGETFQIVDNSTHYRTDSTDLWTENGVKYRKIGFRLDTMMQADRDTLVNLLRTNGKNLPIFISLYPEDSDSNKENMYMMQGKLEDLGQIDHPLTLYYGLPLTFLEI